MSVRLTRRSFALLFGALVGVGAGLGRSQAAALEADGFTLVNGWILKTSDLVPGER